MIRIATIAVIALILLDVAGAIPQASVGGPMAIGLVLIVAALAVGGHEAWSRRRGPFGWIVSLLVAVLGALVAAPLGGAILGPLLSIFAGGRSLAAAGGWPLWLAFAGMTFITLGGASAALWLVGRWRRGAGAAGA